MCRQQKDTRKQRMPFLPTFILCHQFPSVRKITKEGKMKAVVSITLDDEFVVHDIKVIEGENPYNHQSTGCVSHSFPIVRCENPKP